MAAPAEIRIVLLGKTGSGKSSAGNVILGEDKFEVISDPSSVTKECQTEEGTLYGRKISVTDTPGIFDTDKTKSEEDLKYSIISCLTECAPGPHAFILVLRVGRYTEEEKSVKIILEWFGEEALKHTVVFFTHGEDLDNNQTINEFVKRSRDLKELVDKCGGRVHVIDSKHWKENPRSEYRSNSYQIEQLHTTIDTMVRVNEGRYYTNETLQVVADMIKIEENEIKEEMEKRGETAVEPEIKKPARKKLIHKLLIKFVGFSTGALLGAFLGVLYGKFPAIKQILRVLKIPDKKMFSGILVSEAGVAVFGGIMGGIEGATAADSADTVGEAAKNAAVAVMKRATPLPSRSKEKPY